MAASKDVRLALARAVSSKDVSEEAMDHIASQIDFSHKIRGIDPCIYGICFDFVVEREEILDLLESAGHFGPVRVFPWGIPIPDLFHVQIEQDFAQLPRG